MYRRAEAGVVAGLQTPPGARRVARLGLDDLRGEVLQLAEEALKSKERKRLQIGREETLGVKRKKAPRVPQAIGLGIRNARLKKAEKERELLRQSGMLDSGKKPKKRKAKAQNPNKGVTVVKKSPGRGGRSRR